MQRKRQNILTKAIALLLAMQIFLIGFQAKTRIDQGNSTLETLTWLIQQYIPVLLTLPTAKSRGILGSTSQLAQPGFPQEE